MEVDATDSLSAAIDIGNSAAKWITSGCAGEPCRVSLKQSDWADQLIEQASSVDRAIQFRIASVNRPMAKLLVSRIEAIRPQATIWQVSNRDVPMVALVASPDRVGIDRLLAAWGASQLFPNQHAVVVDAGSAITIDCIGKENEFLGGVIMPGLSLQFESLARGTDALPSIDWAVQSSLWNEEDLPVPAVDTVSAIRSGILLGSAASIDSLIERYQQRLEPSEIPVIFTGGDGVLLAKLSRRKPRIMPKLVLDAILALPLSSHP